MTLTTPVTRDSDLAFPGENWFFYWKTSASLWQSKLQDFHFGTQVIIPLNWAFHSDSGESVEFGDVKPETDLHRLVQICEELGKQPVFYIPIGPAPYLVNGGVPHLLARSCATNYMNMAYTLADVQNELIKIFSFFDPRIYKGFRKFISEFSKYLNRTGISADVYTGECLYKDEWGIHSFFDDRSSTFDKGFSKFLRVKKEELAENEKLIKDSGDEKRLIDEYTLTIKELYSSCIEEFLSNYYEDNVNFCYLGSSQRDTFDKLNDCYSVSKFANETIQIASKNIVPCSVLLSNKVKVKGLKDIFNDLILNSIYPQRISPSLYDDDGQNFKLHSNIELYTDSLEFDDFNEDGLIDFLADNFKSLYSFSSIDQFSYEVDESHSVIKFFNSESLGSNSFQKVLRYFMNGGLVVIDTSSLSEELTKRLEIFMLENEIELEEVYYVTKIRSLTLGEGKLICYDGQSVKEADESKKYDFWDRIIRTFELPNIQIKEDKNLVYYWKSRPNFGAELDYQIISRLSLFNPTNYRSKFKAVFPKNFALGKVFNQDGVDLKSGHQEVMMNFEPGGSITLEFGVFES